MIKRSLWLDCIQRAWSHRSVIIWLSGVRRVGKTTLAQRLLEQTGSGAYLNWDDRDDRREIRAAQWPGEGGLVVLDELHKWRGWKLWLKGEFDKHRTTLRFLVTGSARLDLYRRGGDSLQGRYHHYRLHPFSLAELTRGGSPTGVAEPGEELKIPRRAAPDALARLMEAGGFPEPLLSGSRRTHRRWQKERLDRFFREDVRDLEAIRDLSSLEVLADLLPDKVGADRKSVV